MHINNVILAKSNNGKMLSLSQHLMDTVDTMEYLIAHYIAPSVVKASGISSEEFYKIAVFSAATHDIGKATNSFQQKILDSLPEHRAILKQYGIDIVRTGLEKQTPHNLAGAAILNQYFDVDDSICEIIAAHHGKPRERGKETSFSRQIRLYSTNFFSDSSKAVFELSWKEIYKYASQKADISHIHSLSVQCQMIISGLLVMADWIASNDIVFPLFESTFDGIVPDRAKKGIAQFLASYGTLDYNEFGTAFMDESLFASRFGFRPNDMQLQTINVVNNIIEPGIMVIEAPMGLGKTEAALSAAEVLGSGAGSGGVYFGLPTRGTADAMYSRVKAWADKVTSKHSSIELSHSMASYNEEYDKLKAITYDDSFDGVSVNSWMLGRHRRLLSDFIVGTVDQALFVALRKKFLMLLHLGIAAKTVIIDEVHSYDDYMAVFMKSMLSWLGVYHVPVILLSATLTKEKRNELVSSYLGHSIKIESEDYPSLICTDGGKVYTYPIECKDFSSKEIRIRFWAEEESLEDKLKELLSDGGCAGIICDTVGYAQNIYEVLKKTLEESYTVLLLHSRFLPEDRSKLETQVLKLVGKTSIDRNKIIIVGTQVLEQSLDIDFDVIFTEKCPIDLLLQRMGRLHRHKRKKRPASMLFPTCYVFCGADTDKRAKTIYDNYIIEKTDECIKNKININIPNDIRSLTEYVYDVNQQEDTQGKKEYLLRKKELSQKAEAFLLPEVSECEFKGLLSMENPSLNSVRIGINNVDVILLKEFEDHYETFSGCKIYNDKALADDKIKDLLKNKLSLRYDDDLEEEIQDNFANIKRYSWMNNPYLENENVLILDIWGHISIGKREYEYSKEYGWRKLN